MKKQSYPTAHIKATPADFAETVLMPGDPKRSAFVAKEFLTDARLINDVRGVQGYTGLYKGKYVSVMASGMGMPSMGIYSYELFNFFDVKNIIRIGSAGAFQPEMKLGDIVFAMSASTDSNYIRAFGLPGDYAPTADFDLLMRGINKAKSMGLDYFAGNIVSSDVFYNPDPTVNERWAKMGVLCVDMEAAALYANAAYSGRSALALLTVSDQLVTGEAMTSEQRQNALSDMIELALNIA